jgi:hypothetical protein
VAVDWSPPFAIAIPIPQCGLLDDVATRGVNLLAHVLSLLRAGNPLPCAPESELVALMIGHGDGRKHAQRRRKPHVDFSWRWRRADHRYGAVALGSIVWLSTLKGVSQ